MNDERVATNAIRDHYDRLSIFYRAFWGDHIHHGYWKNGESITAAQVNLVELLAERARIPRESRVLDVGCGVGGSSLWLARNFNCEVLGLTISPVQAAMAIAKADDEKLSARVRFEVMDANHLNLTPESFDVVWVVECSEHIRDKANFVGECAHLLKPDGVLALCAWTAAAEIRSSLEQARLIREVCEGMLCPSLASVGDYTGWMRASGFEWVESTDVTGQVEKTWERCAVLVARPEVKMLLRASDEKTRRFVAAFAAMRRAYAEGAMTYNIFTARKARS